MPTTKVGLFQFEWKLVLCNAQIVNQLCGVNGNLRELLFHRQLV